MGLRPVRLDQPPAGEDQQHRDYPGAGAHKPRRVAAQVAQRGVRRLACLTSPGNVTSLRFHRALGFDVIPGNDVVDGVPVHRDHDGPGLHRVLFSCALRDGQLVG